MLPSHFAVDTESAKCADGFIRPVIVTYCPMTARSKDDVVLLLGEDCFRRFFNYFEQTLYNVECCMYNLTYEIAGLIHYLKEYFWVPWTTKKMAAGCFSVIQDPSTCYAVKVTNISGSRMRITDDMLRLGKRSMKSAAEAVRRSEPEWFKGIDEVKLSTEDHYTWYLLPEDDPRRIAYIEYAIQDCYSQAMIMRYSHDRGLLSFLTEASAGMAMALHMRYGQGREDTPESRIRERLEFKKRYPPLPREMQDIVEDSLLGGWVWGKTGTWRGRFTHWDIKSSYPGQYRDGILFQGRIIRVPCTDPIWRRAMDDDSLLKWIVVSFKFELKPSGLPMLNGSECQTWDDRMVGAYNKKMRRGEVLTKLYTLTYFEEIKRNFDLTEIRIHEVWVAKKRSGDFKDFIERCYSEKERPELKGTMEREVWKGKMNKGIHGKTITKTRRKKTIYPNGEKMIIEDVVKPEYCSLIGFTAMMTARERLIRDCRRLREHGFEVYACDTDSIITDCPREAFELIFRGECASGRGVEDLGKWEIELFEGRETFDTLKCWGLKRYCEIDNGRYRKSAFAGMHDDIQSQILIGWETDGREYSWIQNVSCTEDFGKVIRKGMKRARAENVWYGEGEDYTVIPGDPKDFDEYVEELKREARGLEAFRWD